MAAQPFFYYLSSFATLEVDDIEEAARWYREAFGFRAVTRVPGNNGAFALVHLSRGEDQDLVLVRGEGRKPVDAPVLHFAVDSSLDDLVNRAQAAGAELVERGDETAATPASARLRDPQGYELQFFKRAVPHAR